MSGKWDGRERDIDDHYNHNNGGSNDNGWSPRHHDPPTTDPRKIYSVSEASRLHKNPIGENKKPYSIIVRGVVSGIQPMRKMIKGLTKKCMNCNTVFERPYNKPEFFESFVPVEHINKCTQCNTKDYLGAPEYENINAVIVELKDCDTFSEIDPLRIIVFGDDEPACDSTRDIDKHIGETVEVTGDIFTIDISRRRGETKMVAYLYVHPLYGSLQARFYNREILKNAYKNIPETLYPFVLLPEDSILYYEVWKHSTNVGMVPNAIYHIEIKSLNEFWDKNVRYGKSAKDLLESGYYTELLQNEIRIRKTGSKGLSEDKILSLLLILLKTFPYYYGFYSGRIQRED